jgi:hypothetical protein
MSLGKKRGGGNASPTQMCMDRSALAKCDTSAPPYVYMLLYMCGNVSRPLKKKEGYIKLCRNLPVLLDEHDEAFATRVSTRRLFPETGFP